MQQGVRCDFPTGCVLLCNSFHFPHSIAGALPTQFSATARNRRRRVRAFLPRDAFFNYFGNRITGPKRHTKQKVNRLFSLSSCEFRRAEDEATIMCSRVLFFFFAFSHKNDPCSHNSPTVFTDTHTHTHTGFLFGHGECCTGILL